MLGEIEKSSDVCRTASCEQPSSHNSSAEMQLNLFVEEESPNRIMAIAVNSRY